jgi:hypothetical protein
MRDPAYSAHWRAFAAHLRPMVKSRMTIREFSDRIGLSYPHTSRIMTGASGVSRETVGRIACELGLTTQSDILHLYRLAGYPPPFPQDCFEFDEPYTHHDLRPLKELMTRIHQQLEEFRALLEGLQRANCSDTTHKETLNRE